MEPMGTVWEKETGVEEVKAYARGFSVSMSSELWKQLFGWCSAAKGEVSGLGLVQTNGKGAYNINKVYLPKQECTTSSTDIADGEMERIYNSIVAQKGDPKSFRLWWHTHYNFDTFWSGRDTTTIENIAQHTGDYVLSIVLNQKEEYKCRLDLFRPFRLSIQDITINFSQKDDSAFADKCKRDIEKCVSEKTYTPTYSNGYPGYGGYNSGEWRWNDEKRRWDPKEDFGRTKEKLIPAFRTKRVIGYDLNKGNGYEKKGKGEYCGSGYVYYNGQYFSESIYEEILQGFRDDNGQLIINEKLDKATAPEQGKETK